MAQLACTTTPSIATGTKTHPVARQYRTPLTTTTPAVVLALSGCIASPWSTMAEALAAAIVPCCAPPSSIVLSFASLFFSLDADNVPQRSLNSSFFCVFFLCSCLSVLCRFFSFSFPRRPMPQSKKSAKKGRSPLVAAALAVILDGAASLASSPFCARVRIPLPSLLCVVGLCLFCSLFRKKKEWRSLFWQQKESRTCDRPAPGRPLTGRTAALLSLSLPLPPSSLWGVGRLPAGSRERAPPYLGVARQTRPGRLCCARARHPVLFRSRLAVAQPRCRRTGATCRARARKRPRRPLFLSAGEPGGGGAIERGRIRAPQRCARRARRPWP